MLTEAHGGEQLAQRCYLMAIRKGTELTTIWSRVWCPNVTPPSQGYKHTDGYLQPLANSHCCRTLNTTMFTPPKTLDIFYWTINKNSLENSVTTCNTIQAVSLSVRYGDIQHHFVNPHFNCYKRHYQISQVSVATNLMWSGYMLLHALLQFISQCKVKKC